MERNDVQDRSQTTKARAGLIAAAVFLTVFVATASTACGSGPSTMPNKAAQVEAARQSVDARLQGAFRLVDFRPESALEPVLQMLLDAQKNNLVVRFDHGTMTAQSSSLSFRQPYTLTDAYGAVFTLTAPSNSGVLYTSKGEFRAVSGRPEQILFTSETSPMRGTGVLERVGL